MRRIVFLLIAVLFSFVSVAYAQEQAAEKILLRAEFGGFLYRAMPSGGAEKDSILFLELNGGPYERGYQHGALLADRIADVMNHRYSCDVFTPEIQEWVFAAYRRMPKEWRKEVAGVYDGVRAAGYDFPFWKVVLHAVQPIIGNFPWFLCPWEEPANPTGSFSYAVWGNYVAGSGTLAINSPDFGKVPRSLARNRAIFSVRPDRGFRHVFLGVAGVIGAPGFNETGVSLAGTSGPQPVAQRMAMPGNGVKIPKNFTPGFLLVRHALTYLHGGDSALFERFEDLLKKNPVDFFHLQLTAPGRSAVWESGAAASSGYPRNSRRMAGEWDNGHVFPVDWRGSLVLTPSVILNMANLPCAVAVESADSAGEPYSGTCGETYWRHWPLGRAFVLPADAGRTDLFGRWRANLGSGVPTPAPLAVSQDARFPDAIISVAPDRNGGWWIDRDGTSWGWWNRTGPNYFQSFLSDGQQLCAGPLYDFGNGVTGWCRVSEWDVEWLAWTMQFPSGSDQRLDAMNLAVLPAIAPWAKAPYGGVVPHARTHFVLRELGEPSGSLDAISFFEVFRRAYLHVGAEDQPFGVGVYDLQNLNAIFTVGRWEENRYVGGLNPEQIPVFLTRQQLFE